ncbi:MAG TPA: DivIVA domain-containing protein [Syntrophaceae bacterium]|nr:DivIVA domain-containing protein [Syntrophaceae bacterium]
MADEFKNLMDEMNSLKEELRNKTREIEEYKEREKVFKDTIINAQKIMEEMKSNAEKEAHLLISEAEVKAEKILNSAHNRLAQIHEDIRELKRQRTQFETKLRSLIESHLKLLEVEKTEGEEEFEDKLKFLKKD